MNGFAPLFPVKNRSRQLLAFVVASWLGVAAPAGLFAQDVEAPLAPPALPGEIAPAVKPVKQRPAKRYSRQSLPQTVPQAVGAGAVTQLIPTGKNELIPATENSSTGRFGETTELIPTPTQEATTLVKKRTVPSKSARAQSEELRFRKPASKIRQVQAESIDTPSLVPGDGFDVAPLEAVGPTGDLIEPEVGAPRSFEAGNEPALEEAAPMIEEEVMEPAPAAQPAPYEPSSSAEDSDAEETETEPAPLDDRAGNPQPVPKQFNIRRTAAADSLPYNDTGASTFSPKDAVHTVGAGESFWSISKKHYKLGRYSAALAEYNKSRIPRPDRIKPGMKVIVPPVATLEQKHGHLISGYIPATAEAAAPAKPGFFVDANGQPLYRIGKGDTLSDIAQNHLGRSSRWIQIVALNKDTLPNPDEMKLGVVLRLPPDACETIKAD